MSYGGRYADYDDEPSRRQAPRDEVSYDVPIGLAT